MGIDPKIKMSRRATKFCWPCSIELQNLLSWETDGLWCTYLISISFFDFFSALVYILLLIEGDQRSATRGPPLLKLFTGFKLLDIFTICKSGR